MYIPSVLKGHCQVKDLIIFVTNNSFALKWKTTKSCLASSLWLSGQPSAHVPSLTQHSTPCTGCLRLLFFFFLFFSSLFFNRFHQNQILSRSSDFSNKQLFVFPDNWVRLCTWRCPFKIFFFFKKKKKAHSFTPSHFPGLLTPSDEVKFSYQKRLQCPTREPSAGTSPRLPATAAPPAAAVLAVAAPSSGIATLLHFLLVLEALRSFSCPQHPLCLLIPSTVSFIFNDVNYILFIKNCSGGWQVGAWGTTRGHSAALHAPVCAAPCRRLACVWQTFCTTSFSSLLLVHRPNAWVCFVYSIIVSYTD